MDNPQQPRVNDRRARIRYPLKLRVQYQTLRKIYGAVGTGETIDFSSRGFMVATMPEAVPTEGARVRAVVEWPVLLNGTAPLQFVVSGRVVRSEITRFAVSFDRHEFRTMKRKPTSALSDQTRREVG
ncbi:MAG TPA: PilZ domain-containing protein [Bryobacteraceae bacterium]|nr:PilZ domain-containing protein [Bryobacteraceae bacterium]